MKTLITLGFLFPVILLFPGCYTILFIEPTNEDVSFTWNPIIPINPEPLPRPAPPPVPVPYPPCPHPPLPPHPAPIQVVIVNNPPSTSPSTNERRLTHTGRIPLDVNPATVRNDENNKPTRDSGVKRGGR